MYTFSAYAEVHAALTDPALVPLPATESGEVGTMAWLRTQVARFSSGPDHTRRRAMILEDLASMDPAALPASEGDDRRAVVATLAAALGLPDPAAVASAVVTASATYFGGDDPDADRAVARLLAYVLPTVPDPDRLERAANRIALLIQAADATATLIAHARAALPTAPDVDTALQHSLRDNPPVRVMRRVAARPTRIADVSIALGEEVTLDIATASREAGVALTFGVAPRACPGRAHALAIAAVRLEAHQET